MSKTAVEEFSKHVSAMFIRFAIETRADNTKRKSILGITETIMLINMHMLRDGKKNSNIWEVC